MKKDWGKQTKLPIFCLFLHYHCRNASYDLLELAYEANTTEDDEIKISIINKCIAKAKVIDFLVNLSYEKQIINNKRYIKFGESIDEIIKYLVGWKKSIKNQ